MERGMVLFFGSFVLSALFQAPLLKFWLGVSWHNFLLMKGEHWSWVSRINAWICWDLLELTGIYWDLLGVLLAGVAECPWGWLAAPWMALLDAGMGSLVCLGWDRSQSIPVPLKCCV